jgi:methionyl-tRNA formyltransferase
MTRVALFGSGSPASLAALDALSEEFDVAAVVVPLARRLLLPRDWARAMARRRARRGLEAAARRRGAAVIGYSPRRTRGVAARLRALAPELACVATFPYLLPPELLGAAPRGTIGLHPSLLPRHRGPDPLFWAYHDGDTETGVTVHWLDGGEDTGDVILQQAVAIARGEPARGVYLRLAEEGARLLARAVGEIAAGTAPRRPQDPARATREPSPRRAAVRLADVTADRLRHLLLGFGAAAIPLMGRDGPVPLAGELRAWSPEAIAPPGTVQRTSEGWRLHCRDGYVDVR